MKSRQWPPSSQRTSLLAGWLFADLFLVLFIVSLASLPATAHTPPRKPVVKHAVRRPHVQLPRSLDRPVSFVVRISPAAFDDQQTEPGAARQLLSAVDHALSARHLFGRRAGVLLVFASGPPTEIGQAIANARTAAKLTRNKVAGFANVTSAAYWSGNTSGFEFEVFFFSSARSQ